MTRNPFDAVRDRDLGHGSGISEITRVQIAPHQLIPGTRYRIRRWLGEGGMGVVYEAEHVDIGRRVAVKLLQHRFCANPNALELFRQEARASARIGSEGIIEVYDFAELPDGRLMIAMELLEGQDLFAVTRGESEPLAVERTLGIVRQCCRALGAAHAAGIVHRDIKPENIFLITDKGRSDRVKLVDFGVAVVLSGDETHRDVGGTPHYVAPEAIIRNTVGPKIDQYAIGCVAYEMLTGKVAFTGTTVHEIMNAHCESMPPPPRAVCSGVPEELSKVVMRCLAKNPDDRFVDMADLEAAICEAQIAANLVTAWDDLPIPLVSPERRDWLLRNMPEPELGFLPRRKFWPWLAAGMAAVFVLGGVMAAFVSEPDQTSTSTQSGVDERVSRARAAAAKAYYVYPPLDAPKQPTAYKIVRELETMTDGHRPEAKTRAQELRTEFAETLTRLGNHYWDEDGGKTFAQSYYQQALLFNPEIEPALGRASLPGEELELLEAKAFLARFTEAELFEAEPSSILAESDEEVRSRRYRAYLNRRAARLARLDAKLERVGEIDILGRGRETPPNAALRTDEAGEDAEPDPEPGTLTDRDVSTTSRDPSKARAVVRKGRQALASGDEERAALLFERALSLNDRDSLALAGLRDLHFDRGDYGRALMYAKRVVRLEGRDSESRLRLGDAYFKVSRYREAQEEYAAALELGDERARWRMEKARARVEP